jgi:integrase/recombinase XerD
LLRILVLQSLSKDELCALLRTAKASRDRDWLMILVGFWHGLRASEVVGLTATNFHDGMITVQRLKGSNKTIQPLVGHADPLLDERQPLIDYVAAMLPNQRLFPISRVQFFRLVQRYAKAAGIATHKRHPHVLKHTIAMQTIHSVGIENVRQYLGHKTISSTGAYIKVSDGAASKAVQDSLGSKNS